MITPFITWSPNIFVILIYARHDMFGHRLSYQKELFHAQPAWKLSHATADTFINMTGSQQNKLLDYVQQTLQSGRVKSMEHGWFYAITVTFIDSQLLLVSCLILERHVWGRTKMFSQLGYQSGINDIDKMFHVYSWNRQNYCSELLEMAEWNVGQDC